MKRAFVMNRVGIDDWYRMDGANHAYCGSGFRMFYDVPRGANKLWITLSDKPLKEGHRCFTRGTKRLVQVFTTTGMRYEYEYMCIVYDRDLLDLIFEVKGRKKYFWVEVDWE